MKYLETTNRNYILLENSGWNLVGSSYSGQIDDTNNIISSDESIYKYNKYTKNYETVDNNILEAGNGYWIYAISSGYIFINIE